MRRPKNNQGPWRYIPSMDMAIAAPPKVASRSIFLGLVNQFWPGVYTYETATPSEFRKDNPYFKIMTPRMIAEVPCRRVGFVRDPYDRFASLLKHQQDMDKAGLPLKIRGRGSAALMVALQRHQNVKVGANPHLLTQGDLLWPALELVAFECVQDWWQANMRGKLPVVNVGEGTRALTDDERRFVENFYAEDFELRKRLTPVEPTHPGP